MIHTKPKNQQLIMADLSDKVLFDDDIDTVIASLKKNPSINSLNLRRNRITSEGAQKLFEMKQLKAIYLGDNSLGDEGVKLFVSLFEKKQTNITMINVSENGLTDAGIEALISIKGKNVEIIVEPCAHATEDCLSKFRGYRRSQASINAEIEINQTTHLSSSSLVPLFAKKSNQHKWDISKKKKDEEKTPLNKTSFAKKH